MFLKFDTFLNKFDIFGKLDEFDARPIGRSPGARRFAMGWRETPIELHQIEHYAHPLIGSDAILGLSNFNGPLKFSNNLKAVFSTFSRSFPFRRSSYAQQRLAWSITSQSSRYEVHRGSRANDWKLVDIVCANGAHQGGFRFSKNWFKSGLCCGDRVRQTARKPAESRRKLKLSLNF